MLVATLPAIPPLVFFGMYVCMCICMQQYCTRTQQGYTFNFSDLAYTFYPPLGPLLTYLQTPTLSNQNLLARGPVSRPNALDRLDEFLSLNHLAENGVLAVEMRGRDGGDEELGAVAMRDERMARGVELAGLGLGGC